MQAFSAYRRSLFGVVLPVALGLLVATTGIANAHDWSYDDPCGTSTHSNYFYIGGDVNDWYAVSNSAAEGGCYMYTNSETTGSSEYAKIYLKVHSDYDHTYTVRAHLPSDWGCTGDPVRYERFAYGTGDGTPTSNHYVDQDAFSAPGWKAVISGYYFEGSSGGYVKLVDHTGAAPQKVCADRVTWQAW